MAGQRVQVRPTDPHQRHQTVSARQGLRLQRSGMVPGADGCTPAAKFTTFQHRPRASGGLVKLAGCKTSAWYAPMKLRFGGRVQAICYDAGK